MILLPTNRNGLTNMWTKFYFRNVLPFRVQFSNRYSNLRGEHQKCSLWIYHPALSINHSINQSRKWIKFSLQNTILFDNMSAVLVKFDCIVNMALLNVSAVPRCWTDPKYVVKMEPLHHKIKHVYDWHCDRCACMFFKMKMKGALYVYSIIIH